MRGFFGALIATLLLALYVYLVYEGAAVVACSGVLECTSPKPESFTAEMAAALSVVAGLVSALVIAELSITEPGQAPVAQVLDANASEQATRLVKTLAGLYLLVWVGVGAWAFLIALRHATVLPAITNLGQAWFGLAIAAAYAYFGIRRPTAP